MTNKLIYKGVLLYTTFLYIFTILLGIESIVDNGYIVESTAIACIAIYLCYKTISKQEYKKLTWLLNI